MIALIKISEHQLHLLNLKGIDPGLANGDEAALAHLYHLVDIHQGICITLVENVQGMFSDIAGYSVGYLDLTGLANEAAPHKRECFFHMGYRIVLQEVCKLL